jgi:hypothetical protein
VSEIVTGCARSVAPSRLLTKHTTYVSEVSATVGTYPSSLTVTGLLPPRTLPERTVVVTGTRPDELV